ncbi:MAG: sugar kinase [SAR116 cluster bacterium]|nr:sugar kinase [SAR116 cluster bacterium]
MSGMKHGLLAIGEVMAEIRTKGDEGVRRGVAGDSYNTAVYAAREIRVPGAVAYLSRVGSEPLSAAFVKQAAGEGIDVSHVAVDPDRHIGIYSVSTDAHGERSFHYWRSESAARRLFAAEAMSMPDADIIYLSGITLAILTSAARRRLVEVLISRRSAGAKVAFDSNYRSKLWENVAAARRTVQAMWDITDIALPSVDDEMALFGDLAEAAVIERFAGRDWDGIAIKRGIRGPISPQLDAAAHPKFPTTEKVIDTTAAGDSFNGGYLAAFLAGKGEAERLAAGHALAARVVGAPGAILPRRDI